MTEGISALGTYGGLGAGAYNYYDPTMMMGMMNGVGGNYWTNPMMNPMMMGGYGMGMGMSADSTENKNPYLEMYKQYYEAMEKLEEQRLEHQVQMHKKTQLAEVANLSDHDQSFFLKAVQDGDIQHGIREIHDAIRRKNLSYATQKFYELKQEIYNRFSEYFQSTEGNINTDEKIKQYICILYSEIAGAYASSGGIKPDLKDDFDKYGENSFENAFNSHWFGNKNHNQLTGEQAKHQCFGTAEQDTGTKAIMAKLGTGTAAVGEVATASAIGGAVGATGFALGRMLLPNKLGWGKISFEHNLAKKFNLKRLPGAIKFCALGLGIADAFWQFTR